jgi:hypothetical protein
MPVPGWFVLCEMPLQDFTGHISCHHIVDQVVASPFEMPPDAPPEYRAAQEGSQLAVPPMFACVNWCGVTGDENKTFHQRFSITAPDERETFVEQETVFSMTTPFHRVIQGLPPIAIRIPGAYAITLHLRPDGGAEDRMGVVIFNVITKEQLRELGQDHPDAMRENQMDDSGHLEA